MRIVFVGAGSLTVIAARQLLEAGHEVVVVERDEERIEELSESLDCGFLHGDGSRPAVLEEVGPERSDFLFCVGASDQDNIIAGLIGQSLEFGRVVVRIEDPGFEPICAELGLQNALIPDREAANQICDMVAGRESTALAGVLEGGVRFFSFVAGDDRVGAIAELDLPGGSRVIALTREGRSRITRDDDRIEKKDAILVITNEDEIETLRERFEKK